MTTAHKPTWHPAVGGGAQGGYRYHAPRMQYAARDMAAHTKLKIRQVGQAAPDEVEARDLKAELKDREEKHQKKILEEKARKGLLPPEKMSDTSKMLKSIDFSKFDDSDDSDSESDKSDDAAEEAELMKELERVRKEREEDKRRKQEEAEAEQALQQNEEFLKGNPLLNSATFTVKRRWDEDVPFKNQSRGEQKVQKKFINDTIRSQFHRSFLKKYIQ